MIVICFKICMSLKINERISNLQRSMSKIYYMSPKIHGTEKYSHGFLEISGSDYIIVSRIFGDIWKIYVSKNPWEYISVPRISWILRIFGDIPKVLFFFNCWFDSKECPSVRNMAENFTIKRPICLHRTLLN